VTEPADILRIGSIYRDRVGVWRDADTHREVRVWQRFRSGRRLNLLDPSPFDFEDEDIALGASRIPRWHGQTSGPWAYSVAQHSVHCVELLRLRAKGRLEPRLALACLLHDADEALALGDQITPVKPLLGGGYKIVAANLQRVAFAKYGLPEIMPATWKREIKRVDRIMAATEAIQIGCYSEAELFDPKVLGYSRREPPAADFTIEPWPAETARRRFLDELTRLKPPL
jgi:5'-deoxynucleotidase YfbR-like HD superfamily hydrolase